MGVQEGGRELETLLPATKSFPIFSYFSRILAYSRFLFRIGWGSVFPRVLGYVGMSVGVRKGLGMPNNTTRVGEKGYENNDQFVAYPFLLFLTFSRISRFPVWYGIRLCIPACPGVRGCDLDQCVWTGYGIRIRETSVVEHGHFFFVPSSYWGIFTYHPFPRVPTASSLHRIPIQCLLRWGMWGDMGVGGWNVLGNGRWREVKRFGTVNDSSLP